LDPEWLAERQQVFVAGDQMGCPRRQGAREKGIVPGIPAALFAQRRRFDPNGPEPKPGEGAGAVAGRKPGLKLRSHRFVLGEQPGGNRDAVLPPGKSGQTTAGRAIGQ
jgi:hypothetical protein